jgi:hypothetical protein
MRLGCHLDFDGPSLSFVRYYVVRFHSAPSSPSPRKCTPTGGSNAHPHGLHLQCPRNPSAIVHSAVEKASRARSTATDDDHRGEVLQP